MDWIEGLYEKAENKWKRMSLKKAMVIYILFVFLFVAVAYFLTVRICETEIDMLRRLYFIKKLTRIPQPLQAGDELCRVLP